MRKHVLVYDADCGPCTRFKRIVDFLDAHERLDFTSLIQADEGGFLSSVPPALRHHSFHLISPDGGIRSGALAVPELIGVLPSGKLISKFIASAPGGVWSLSFVYEVLSRLHEVGSCRYETGNSD